MSEKITIKSVDEGLPKRQNKLDLENQDKSKSEPSLGKRMTKAILKVIAILIIGGIGGVLFDHLLIPYLATKEPFKNVAFFQEVTTNQINSTDSTVNVEINDAITETVKEASPAVVSIVASAELTNVFGQTFNQQSSGTGFIVTSDGLILTNRHVVSKENADYSVITQEGKDYQAVEVIRDSVNDLAFLKIAAKDLPVLELGASADIKVGETVVAIGNALGTYQNTVTSGIISGLDRSLSAGSFYASQTEKLEGVIQTDASINPGNSGGPLLNLNGQVIGINTAIDQSGQLIGFAIPIDDAKKAVDSVIKKGRIIRPILGVRYIPITAELADLNDLPVDYGILLYSDSSRYPAVLPDTPAADAKLRSNDIILKINDQLIGQPNSFSKIMQDFDPADEITVEILREEKRFSIKIILAEQES
ncbi:MAG: hypothetical protein ACD_68C00134G0002, partial [uncultured bacterium]